MASNVQQEKKMEFKKVSFDVNEITPDAPAGEWKATIPRGKCKIQPTKEEKLPMVLLPIRLESTEEEGEEFQRALGTELTVFLVFGGKNPRAERMSKLRIRQVCEAADVDLDDVPKEIESADDLEPFTKLLEGKKLTVWTVLQTRRDTGEVTTEVRFQDPKGALSNTSDDADEDADEDDDGPKSARSPRGASKSKAKTGNGKRR